MSLTSDYFIEIFEQELQDNAELAQQIQDDEQQYANFYQTEQDPELELGLPF